MFQKAKTAVLMQYPEAPSMMFGRCNGSMNFIIDACLPPQLMLNIYKNMGKATHIACEDGLEMNDIDSTIVHHSTVERYDGIVTSDLVLDSENDMGVIAQGYAFVAMQLNSTVDKMDISLAKRVPLIIRLDDKVALTDNYAGLIRAYHDEILAHVRNRVSPLITVTEKGGVKPEMTFEEMWQEHYHPEEFSKKKKGKSYIPTSVLRTFSEQPSVPECIVA